VILLRKKLFTQATKNLEKAKKQWTGEPEELAQVMTLRAALWSSATCSSVIIEGSTLKYPFTGRAQKFTWFAVRRCTTRWVTRTSTWRRRTWPSTSTSRRSRSSPGALHDQLHSAQFAHRSFLRFLDHCSHVAHSLVCVHVAGSSRNDSSVSAVSLVWPPCAGM